MSDRVCCRILSQIPLFKCSDAGLIVRVQASKYVSEDEQRNAVFDVLVEDIAVPTSDSRCFSTIGVNTSGELVQLGSESCCVVAVIPWNEEEEVDCSASSRVSSMPLGKNSDDRRTRRLPPPHKYGLFDDELDDFEFCGDSAKRTDNPGESSGVNQGEIASVRGVKVFGFGGNMGAPALVQSNYSRTSPTIVCSKWYSLDSHTLFVMVKEANNSDLNVSKIMVFDLASIGSGGDKYKVSSADVGDNNAVSEEGVSVVNVLEFKTEREDRLGKSKPVFPVDFAFGRGPDIWSMLTLFVLFNNNTIRAVCPVVTNRMRLPYFAYEVFYSSLIEQEFILETVSRRKHQGGDCVDDEKRTGSRVLETEKGEEQGDNGERKDRQRYIYDASLHKLLQLLTGDLRNPVDDKTGEIIDDHLQIDISDDSYSFISEGLILDQTELKLNWNADSNNRQRLDGVNGNKVSSLKLSCITNYPLSVFVVFNSKSEMGLFTCSYLSLPRFKQGSQDKSGLGLGSRESCPEEEFRYNTEYLHCVQNYIIPREWSSVEDTGSGKEDKDENAQTDDCVSGRIEIFDQNGEGEWSLLDEDTSQALFAIGIRICNTLAVIHIDWLQFVFSLHLSYDLKDRRRNRTVAMENKKNIDDEYGGQENQLKVYNNLEAVRRYLGKNKEMTVYKLDTKENLDLDGCCLAFKSNHSKQTSPGAMFLEELSGENITIEFIYPYLNTSKSLNCAKLESSSVYQELPCMISSQLFKLEFVRKSYFLNEKLLFEIKLFLESTDNQSELTLCDEKDCNSSKESYRNSIFREIADYNTHEIFKQYYDSLHKIKKEFENIAGSEEMANYNLKILKLLNEFNKEVVVKLNSYIKPTMNLVDNVKSRISLLNELKLNITEKHNQLLTNEERINDKIKETIENNEKLYKRISNIKKMFIQELNIHRIKYNQEIILPEILLMLSNAQLELCSCIINVFNNHCNPNSNFIANGDISSIINSHNNGSLQTSNNCPDNLNDINIKLHNYINHNRNVLDKYQSLQNKAIELNKYIKD